MRAKCVICLIVERWSSLRNSFEIILYTHQCCFTTAGKYQISFVNLSADVCVGGNTSFEIQLIGADDLYNLKYFWGRDYRYLPKSEHLEERVNGTVLDIKNALPKHAGNYTFYLLTKKSMLVDSISFELKVRGKIIAICKLKHSLAGKHRRDFTGSFILFICEHKISSSSFLPSLLPVFNPSIHSFFHLNVFIHLQSICPSVRPSDCPCICSLLPSFYRLLFLAFARFPPLFAVPNLYLIPLKAKKVCISWTRYFKYWSLIHSGSSLVMCFTHNSIS